MSLWQTFSGGTSTGGAALYSRAHLHELMVALSGRPTTDASMSEALRDQLLTLAQARWYSVIASVAPEALYGPPMLLATDDGGLTYRFGADDANVPVSVMGHVELLRGQRGGPVLLPGVSWAPGGFLVEGNVIRWADGRQRTFAEGLYARAVVAPNVIDADHEPTLMPKDARVLLVYRALALWAKRARRDPAEFLLLEKEAWAGDPKGGDHGILGRLRTQYNLIGAQAVDDDTGLRWWDSPDLGIPGPPYP